MNNHLATPAYLDRLDTMSVDQMLENRQKRLSLLGENFFSPTALGPRTTDPLGFNKPKIYSP